jgi:hypothetical protein
MKICGYINNIGIEIGILKKAFVNRKAKSYDPRRLY